MAVMTGLGMLGCLLDSVSLTMFEALLADRSLFLMAVLCERRAQARTELAQALTNTTIDQNFHDEAIICIGDDPSGGGD